MTTENYLRASGPHHLVLWRLSFRRELLWGFSGRGAPSPPSLDHIISSKNSYGALLLFKLSRRSPFESRGILQTTFHPTWLLAKMDLLIRIRIRLNAETQADRGLSNLPGDQKGNSYYMMYQRRS